MKAETRGSTGSSGWATDWERSRLYQGTPHPDRVCRPRRWRLAATPKALANGSLGAPPKSSVRPGTPWCACGGIPHAPDHPAPLSQRPTRSGVAGEVATDGSAHRHGSDRRDRLCRRDSGNLCGLRRSGPWGCGRCRGCSCNSRGRGRRRRSDCRIGVCWGSPCWFGRMDHCRTLDGAIRVRSNDRDKNSAGRRFRNDIRCTTRRSSNVDEASGSRCTVRGIRRSFGHSSTSGKHCSRGD